MLFYIIIFIIIVYAISKVYGSDDSELSHIEKTTI